MWTLCGCTSKCQLDQRYKHNSYHTNGCYHFTNYIKGAAHTLWVVDRALCRIKLLPVAHVLVDTRMLTVKPVYKLSNVPDDLKLAKNTHVTPFTLTFKEGITNDINGFSRLFFFFLLHPPPIHPYFYPFTHISTRSFSFLPVQMTGGRVST